MRLQIADRIAGRLLGVDVGLSERQEGKKLPRLEATRFVAAEELQEAAGATLEKKKLGPYWQWESVSVDLAAIRLNSSDSMS